MKCKIESLCCEERPGERPDFCDELCENYIPADLPEVGAPAERISSVVRSNADETENLKCCGNCLHRSTIDMGSYSDETCNYDNNLASWQYCGKWEFDGIERSGRTEGYDEK